MQLVLLPGMDGTGELFAPFLAELPEGLTTTVVAYPRTETLDWDGLADLVAQAVPNDAPYCILAESFSGPVAIRFASQAPNGLCGVVLCASFVRSPLARGVAWIARGLGRGLFRLTPPAALVRRYLLDRNASPELVELMRQAVASVAPSVLAKRARMISRMDMRAELGRLELPIHYLQGKNDRMVGESAWASVKDVCPGATRSILEGPHLLLQSTPKQAASDTMDFMRRVGC